MAFVGSYLWKLRQVVGSELVLMPGAMVVVQRGDGDVLLTKRGDTGAWCLPGGAAEVGGSFAQTAIDELLEETSIQVPASSLIPFGCLSEASTHTIRYPDGDLTHCFAMCFLARDWEGEPKPDQAESTAVLFTGHNELPVPMHGPSAHALALFHKYLDTGDFQVA
jgi:8-oxo-dGTP pyrophosphatase MutT (NUDIX family)